MSLIWIWYLSVVCSILGVAVIIIFTLRKYSDKNKRKWNQQATQGKTMAWIIDNIFDNKWLGTGFLVLAAILVWVLVDKAFDQVIEGIKIVNESRQANYDAFMSEVDGCKLIEKVQGSKTIPKKLVYQCGEARLVWER